MPDRKGLMAYAVTPWRSLAWTLVQLQQVHLAVAGSTAEAVSAGRGMADGVTFPAANGGNPMVSWEQGLKAAAPGADGKCALS